MPNQGFPPFLSNIVYFGPRVDGGGVGAAR